MVISEGFQCQDTVKLANCGVAGTYFLALCAYFRCVQQGRSMPTSGVCCDRWCIEAKGIFRQMICPRQDMQNCAPSSANKTKDVSNGHDACHLPETISSPRSAIS